MLSAFARLVDHQRRSGGLSRRTEQVLANAVRSLPMTTTKARRRKSPAVSAVVSAFNRLYYNDKGTWRSNTWLGVRTWKSPTDLWLYQEIISAVRPGLIIETGTAFGGSALYLGTICDAVDHGRVVSIDIAPKVTVDRLPQHPRVSYLTGSSTDPGIVDQARAMVPTGEPVLVILDSDHSEAHVRNELMAYADLVTSGSYLIVEDSNVNGHPVYPTHGPGPWEAVQWFMGQRSDFTIDRSMHRHHLTFNPRGYLRRR